MLVDLDQSQVLEIISLRRGQYSVLTSLSCDCEVFKHLSERERERDRERERIAQRERESERERERERERENSRERE